MTDASLTRSEAKTLGYAVPSELFLFFGLNSYWSAPSVPPPTKKIVENVIDVEIDLSRFRQVSNTFCRRLFAFVGNMFPTCWKLVGNLSKTCCRLCRKRVFDMFSTR